MVCPHLDGQVNMSCWGEGEGEEEGGGWYGG